MASAFNPTTGRYVTVAWPMKVLTFDGETVSVRFRSRWVSVPAVPVILVPIVATLPEIGDNPFPVSPTRPTYFLSAPIWSVDTAA